MLVFATSALLPEAATVGGTRALAAVTVGLSLLGLAVGGGVTPWDANLGRLPACGALALGALTLLGGHRLWLELLPAFIWICVALAFARSLAEPPSLVERLARLIERDAPEFIAPYCRMVTRIYVVLFTLNGVLIAAFALADAHAAWRWLSGLGVWLVLGAFQLAELLVRKLYFRHYGRNPLDRGLAHFFPAERTARGRRSMAHLRARAQSRAAARRTGNATARSGPNP